MIVEVWSDVVCPWCYIGKRRFETAVAGFNAEHPEVEIDVRYRAYLLDPTAPVGSSQPVREVYEKKFGGPERAQEILDTVTREAAGEGLEFRMDIAQRSNTLLAHRLLVLGEKVGLQGALKERLLAAYFTEGRSVGDPDVLVELAIEAGLDGDESRRWLDGDDGRNEVADQLDFAVANGLSGVPTFVFDRERAVTGAQEPAVFTMVMENRVTDER